MPTGPDDPTCRVCSETWEELFSFLCQFQYALAKDPNTQAEFRTSFGLCPGHTWLLEQLSSPRGRCDSFPALLDDLAGGLETLADLSPRQAGAGLEALLGTLEHCALCRAKTRFEQQALRRVHRDLGTAPDHPVDLCLPHLTVVLKGEPPGASAFLLRHHAQRLATLAQGMRGYAAKFDALRRGDITPEENASPRAALEALVGTRNLSSLRTLE